MAKPPSASAAAYSLIRWARFLTYRVTGQNAPWGVTVTESSGPYHFQNPWGNVPGGNPFPLPLFPPSNYVFPQNSTDTFLEPKALPPALETWNLGIQHQFAQNWIATITYLGNETSHLMVGNEINPAVYIPGTWTGAGTCGALTVAPGANGTACSGTGNTQARRFLSLINPAQGKYYSATDFGFNGISANYEGVLASIEHRFADNYTILANYTFGHCHSVIPVTSLGGPTIENPANPKATTVLAPTMHPTSSMPAWSTSAISDSQSLPFRSCSSDWQIAPLLRYETGFPVNPVDGTDRSLTGISLDRPNVNAGVALYSSTPRHSEVVSVDQPRCFLA